MSVETERKFLIKLPDTVMLSAINGCRTRHIVQTYLTEGEGGVERRVRMISEGGRVSYVYTEKVHLTGISREERECEVSESRYLELYAEAYSELKKTRYDFPYRGHVIEIDVYPYEIGGEALVGHAVLEVELSSEEEGFDLPEFVTVVRELTGTREFSNKVLAKKK